MANHPGQIEPLEQLLMELEEAEQAGVFGQTVVDTRKLVCAPVRPASPPSGLHWVRLLPVAAAVAFTVCLWSWTSRPAHIVTRTAFHDCFAGPTGGTMTTCRQHDYDTDGDVDLADFSAYQLAFAGVTR